MDSDHRDPGPVPRAAADPRHPQVMSLIIGAIFLPETKDVDITKT
jgi:hypothetical protein